MIWTNGWMIKHYTEWNTSDKRVYVKLHKITGNTNLCWQKAEEWLPGDMRKQIRGRDYKRAWG